MLNIIPAIFNKLSNTLILATITLTNGQKLHNKYILRPSVDGIILIGDKPSITEDCTKIMLPKQLIMYIEFRRVHITYTKEVDSLNRKRILLPPDFK